MTHETMNAPAAPREGVRLHPVTVKKVIWETDDTFTLQIDLGALGNTFNFLPGQFNMLYVFGLGEAAISISSDASQTGTLAHTIHRVGTVTSGLAQVKRGDVIGLRGPFGAGWPRPPGPKRVGTERG